MRRTTKLLFVAGDLSRFDLAKHKPVLPIKLDHQFAIFGPDVLESAVSTIAGTEIPHHFGSAVLKLVNINDLGNRVAGGLYFEDHGCLVLAVEIDVEEPGRDIRQAYSAFRFELYLLLVGDILGKMCRNGIEPTVNELGVAAVWVLPAAGQRIGVISKVH